ncbi:hypothetical protein [Alteromonas flava]|uniref:hypothetical protein n=1 Tax=Alteromonas flava TaxID=2048003 RepID=UPI000C28AD64|nr:hypothetical protein [Alteromonas flava]
MVQTKEFEIDGFSYTVANDAIKEILFMYYSMDNYNGFGSAETGLFNPYWFLKVKISEAGYLAIADVQLLQQGAAIKILNWIYGEILDYENNILPEGHWSKSLLESGAMERVPEAEQALKAAHVDFPSFEKQLSRVYKTLVKGFFRTYANS